MVFLLLRLRIFSCYHDTARKPQAQEGLRKNHSTPDARSQKEFVFPPPGAGLLQLGGETGQLLRRDCTGRLGTQRGAAHTADAGLSVHKRLG